MCNRMEKIVLFITVASLFGCSTSFITELSQLSTGSKRFRHCQFATTTFVDPKIYLHTSEPAEIGESLQLPSLTRKERQALLAGERLQKQTRDGRSGNGVVVFDVQAPAGSIFEALTQFDRYDEMIPTVRSVKVHGKSQFLHKAEFSLSKFRLKVNVVHTVVPEKNLIKFSLDESRPNVVLKRAEGFWFVEQPTDRPEGFSRVWLSASITTSRVLPYFVVDYAAARAFPRATEWLRSFVGEPMGLSLGQQNDAPNPNNII